MADIEKVIKGLEICTKDIPMSNAVHKSDFCKECPYYNAKNRYCWNQIVMMRDALALLKEQGVKHGEWISIWQEDDPDTSTHARCSVCNRVSKRPAGEYCRWCGAKMDLEGR